MQRLPSTLAILDNLPRGSGVVVIGINHATFVSSQADAESQLSGTPLLLASPALRDVTAATYGQAPAADIGEDVDCRGIAVRGFRDLSQGRRGEQQGVPAS